MSAKTRSFFRYFQEEGAAQKPWALWLTGGPGCSSMTGLFEENGYANYACRSLLVSLHTFRPFFVNPDGQTIFENVYSWHKAVNILYLESPRGVGFSYRDRKEGETQNPNDKNVSRTNEQKNVKMLAVQVFKLHFSSLISIILTQFFVVCLQTAEDVVAALADFLTIFTELKDRNFYITGESYAGIYIPTTTERLMDELVKPNNGSFSGLGINFRGFLIGNGCVSFTSDVSRRCAICSHFVQMPL